MEEEVRNVHAGRRKQKRYGTSTENSRRKLGPNCSNRWRGECRNRVSIMPLQQEKVWPIRSCEFQKILTRNHNKNSQFEVNDEPAIGHTLPTLTPPRDHIVRFRCNGSAYFWIVAIADKDYCPKMGWKLNREVTGVDAKADGMRCLGR